jgi:hypothetical protein
MERARGARLTRALVKRQGKRTGIDEHHLLHRKAAA